MHEEIIGKRVPVIEKEIWEFAANHWRLPYWDWADNSNVPKLIELPSVTIVVSVTPRKTMDVENPLWKFKMPTGKPMGDKVHGKFAITYADGLPVSSMHRYFKQNLTKFCSLTCASPQAGTASCGAT